MPHGIGRLKSHKGLADVKAGRVKEERKAAANVACRQVFRNILGQNPNESRDHGNGRALDEPFGTTTSRLATSPGFVSDYAFFGWICHRKKDLSSRKEKAL